MIENPSFDPKIIDEFGLATLSGLLDPIILLDDQNRILYLNNSGESFFANSLSQLFKQDWQNFLPKDHVLLRLPDRVRSQKASLIQRDITLFHPRIGEHNFDASLSLIELPKLESPAVAIHLHLHPMAGKIDQVKQQQGGLRQIGGLIAMLAHEVRNPLSGIRGAAQLIEPMLPPQERKWPQMILQESDRVSRLLEQLDIFNHNPSLERKAVNIHEVLDRVCVVASSSFALHLKLDRDYDPSLPLILANFDQMVQVFLNLVKNAAEAVDPKHGVIKIETSFVRGMRLQFGDRQNAPPLSLKVVIEDNGCGINPAIKDHLFEAFISSKPDGNGIGLALTAKLINDHGGVIDVESRKGMTRFQILLPFADYSKTV